VNGEKKRREVSLEKNNRERKREEKILTLRRARK